MDVGQYIYHRSHDHYTLYNHHGVLQGVHSDYTQGCPPVVHKMGGHIVHNHYYSVFYGVPPYIEGSWKEGVFYCLQPSSNLLWEYGHYWFLYYCPEW